jgi:hypothetical protein
MSNMFLPEVAEELLAIDDNWSSHIPFSMEFCTFPYNFYVEVRDSPFSQFFKSVMVLLTSPLWRKRLNNMRVTCELLKFSAVAGAMGPTETYGVVMFL